MEIMFWHRFNNTIMLMWSKHCCVLVKIVYLHCPAVYEYTWCSALNQYDLVFWLYHFCKICIVYHSVCFRNWKREQKNQTWQIFCEWKIKTNAFLHIISSCSRSLLLVQFDMNVYLTVGTDLWWKPISGHYKIKCSCIFWYQYFSAIQK